MGGSVGIHMNRAIMADATLDAAVSESAVVMAGFRGLSCACELGCGVGETIGVLGRDEDGDLVPFFQRGVAGDRHRPIRAAERQDSGSRWPAHLSHLQAGEGGTVVEHQFDDAVAGEPVARASGPRGLRR